MLSASIRSRFRLCLLLLMVSCSRAALAEAPATLQLTFEQIPMAPHPRDGREGTPHAWQRETARQALLLTARHEFGLLPRDEQLGDIINRDDPACIHAQVVSHIGIGTDVTFRRTGKVIHHSNLDIPGDERDFYRLPLEWQERLSRTDYVQMLLDAGYTRRPLPRAAQFKLSPRLAARLELMDHVAMYSVLRELHALLRTQGESPELQGALCRAYIHMAYLTQPVLDCRFSTYEARAGLYAQRMISQEPDSPQGYWHRALVWMFSGMPNLARSDFEIAARLGGDLSTAPAWVRLAKLSQEYNVQELSAVAKDESSLSRQLAAAMWMITVRHSTRAHYRVETGKQSILAAPTSLTMLSEITDWSAGDLRQRLRESAPKVHAESLHEFLPGLPQAPSTAIDLLRDVVIEDRDAEFSIAKLARELRARGAEDEAEPSWSVLGRNIEEWNLAHVFRVPADYYVTYSWPLKEFVSRHAQLFEGNHAEPLFLALALARTDPESEFQKIGVKNRWCEFNFESQALDVLMWMTPKFNIGPSTRVEMYHAMWESNDANEHALAKAYHLWIADERTKKIKRLRTVSENSPMIPRELALLDYAGTRAQHADWEQQFSRSPDVLWALAHGAAVSGELPNAISRFRNCLRLQDDPEVRIDLADALYRSGDQREWKTVLEQVLELEDFSATHFKAVNILCGTALNEGNWGEAERWCAHSAMDNSSATIEARIWSAFAQKRIQEAQRIAADAEQCHPEVLHYRWALIIGGVDPDAKFQEYIDAECNEGTASHVINFNRGMKLLADNGDPGEVVKLMLPKYELTHYQWEGLVLSVVADRAGQVELRDRAWKRLADTGPQAAGYTPLCPLAGLLRECSLSGKFDEASYLKLRETEPHRFDRDWRCELDVVVAYWLRTHHQPEQAAKYIEQAGRRFEDSGWAHTLACAWLKAEGKDPWMLKNKTFHKGLVRDNAAAR